MGKYMKITGDQAFAWALGGLVATMLLVAGLGGAPLTTALAMTAAPFGPLLAVGRYREPGGPLLVAMGGLYAATIIGSLLLHRSPWELITVNSALAAVALPAILKGVKVLNCCCGNC